MPKSYFDRANEIKEEIIRIRRQIHKNPEVGFDLPLTKGLVKSELIAMGLEPEEVGHGIVAVIKGSLPGKTIMLRADMDALPIPENTNLDFKSENGMMHACGHDLHTSMLLGAAKLLLENKEKLSGNVKLVFQPAEELCLGAQAMLDEGVLENPKVDAAMCIHVTPEYKVGTIGYNQGEIATSSVDSVKIHITGKGTHIGWPHLGIDPIAAGVDVYNSVQHMIAQEVPPKSAAIMNITSFDGPSAKSIIPEKITLMGTLYAKDNETRGFCKKRLKDIIDGISTTTRTTMDVSYICEVGVVNNNPEFVKKCVGFMQDLDTGLHFFPVETLDVADDFAIYTEHVPAMYMGLGCQPFDPNDEWPLHNPNVIFNEDCIPYGVAMHAQSATRWLENNK